MRTFIQEECCFIPSVEFEIIVECMARHIEAVLVALRFYFIFVLGYILHTCNPSYVIETEWFHCFYWRVVALSNVFFLS